MGLAERRVPKHPPALGAAGAGDPRAQRLCPHLPVWTRSLVGPLPEGSVEVAQLTCLLLPSPILWATLSPSHDVEVLWAGREMGKAAGFLTTGAFSVFMAQAVKDFVRILCCPALLSFPSSPCTPSLCPQPCEVHLRELTSEVPLYSRSSQHSLWLNAFLMWQNTFLKAQRVFGLEKRGWFSLMAVLCAHTAREAGGPSSQAIGRAPSLGCPSV